VGDVTVLLATRNRAALLAQTLDSFTRLEVADLQWEVIVADNGSTDATTNVLQSFASRLPLRSVEEHAPGKNAALNRALPLARGDIVLFTDDDVVPRPDWLIEMTRAVRRWEEDDIFGGRIVPLFPPKIPEWIRDTPYAGALFAEFNPDKPEGPIRRPPFGPNYAIRASALANVQFASHLGPNGASYPAGGETELIMRLMNAGRRAIYVPTAEVGHVVRDEQLQRGWIFRRAHNFGRGRVQLAHMSSAGLGSPAVARWRMLTNGALYCAFAPFDRRKGLEHGALFHVFRGELDERRRLMRELASSRSAGRLDTAVK
jgi:glucosyl-dolichyl phosphate glucuronosyltransferase